MGAKELAQLLQLSAENAKMQEICKKLDWHLEPLERLLKYMGDITGTIWNVDIQGNNYRKILILLFTDVQNGILASFGMLLRGHLKQAFACFRPVVESVGYAWQMHSDTCGNKVDAWLNCQDWKVNEVSGEWLNAKEMNDEFKKNFHWPHHQDIKLANWPLYRLALMWEDCSKWGSHTSLLGIRLHIRLPAPVSGFQTSYFNLEEKFIWPTYRRFIEMTRHACAVMSEVLKEAFPSPTWQDLDKTILHAAMVSCVWKDNKEQSLDVIDVEASKYNMDSSTFKDKILEIGEGLGRAAVQSLIDWIDSLNWNEPQRAEKAKDILRNEIQPKQSEPEFPHSDSEFLNVITKFPSLID